MPLHAAIEAVSAALAGDDAEPLELAEARLRDALAALEPTVGGQDADVASALHHLSLVAHRRGDLATAEALAQRSLRVGDGVTPAEPIAATLVHLATLHRASQRFRAAEDDYRRALALLDRALARDGGTAAAARAGYADLLVELGREGEAVTIVLE